MRIKREFKTPNRIVELFRNIEIINSAVRSGKNSVNFNHVDWVTPLSVLPLAAHLSKNNMSVNFNFDNEKAKSFLINNLKFPGGHVDPYFDTTNVPICKIHSNYKQLLTNFESNLLRSINVDCLTTPIKLLTAELEANVGDHSNEDHYWLHAQYYPKTKNCEICLADTGIGIKNSYVGTAHETKTHEAAVLKAITGVSSKTIERGSGIPTIIKLFTKGLKGEFMLMSGDCAIYIYHKKGISYELPFEWGGTVAFIKFPIPRSARALAFDYTKYIK